MDEVVVVIGVGTIGQVTARRVSAGRHVVLADLRHSNADATARVMADAGFEVSTATVDVSLRESIHAPIETSAALGGITGVIHGGVSPRQASPQAILRVDLYGTAVLLGLITGSDFLMDGGVTAPTSTASSPRIDRSTFEVTAGGASSRSPLRPQGSPSRDRPAASAGSTSEGPAPGVGSQTCGRFSSASRQTPATSPGLRGLRGSAGPPERHANRAP